MPIGQEVRASRSHWKLLWRFRARYHNRANLPNTRSSTDRATYVKRKSTARRGRGRGRRGRRVLREKLRQHQPGRRDLRHGNRLAKRLRRNRARFRRERDNGMIRRHAADAGFLTGRAREDRDADVFKNAQQTAHRKHLIFLRSVLHHFPQRHWRMRLRQAT